MLQEEKDLVKTEENGPQTVDHPTDTQQESPPQPSGSGQPEPGKEAPAQVQVSAPATAVEGNRWAATVDQIKLRKFFVLRPGILDHAIGDIKALVNQEEDGAVDGVWLVAEIDHWNNERERLVLITENSLLICKYDFIMLICEQIQKVPLNFVDRISHGTFCFPPRSLLTREGEGMRVFWDRLREPSFTSRWNPFAIDYPFTTFTYHPVHKANETVRPLCELHSFRERLMAAAQRAHIQRPVLGKANGVLLLNQPILIEAYVGFMSIIGNQNKLGYCLARGNIGF